MCYRLHILFVAVLNAAAINHCTVKYKNKVHKILFVKFKIMSTVKCTSLCLLYLQEKKKSNAGIAVK